MLVFGIILIIIGLIVSLGGFVFSAKNMSRMASDFHKPGRDFSAGFDRHMKSMIPVAIGGGAFILGIVLVAIHFVSKVVS